MTERHYSRILIDVGHLEVEVCKSKSYQVTMEQGEEDKSAVETGFVRQACM